MSERRKIVAMFKMPERATKAEVIAMVADDVREATSALRKELTNKATTLHVNGFVLDEDSWEFATNGRTVVGTVVVGR